MNNLHIKNAENELRALGGTVAHHFGAGTYAKEAIIPKGTRLAKHTHPFDHLSLLASGRVIVYVDGVGTVHDAPKCLTVKAGAVHEVEALEDSTWFCIHATDETDPEHIDDALINDGKKIELLARGMQVNHILWALQKNPQIWDTNNARTGYVQSPHYQLHDVWVRYAPDMNYVGDGSCEHDIQWLIDEDTLPVRGLIDDIMQMVGGKELGGVLITRIPAGKTCLPHVDVGWHAENFEKIGVQIQSAPNQKFCFESEELETVAGDVFWFDNRYLHWVTNPTPYDRVTMIFGFKRGE